VQRIFNCDKIQDDILTLDKVLNCLMHGSPFCVIIYTSYKLSQMSGVYWATLHIWVRYRYSWVIRVTGHYSRVGSGLELTDPVPSPACIPIDVRAPPAVHISHNTCIIQITSSQTTEDNCCIDRFNNKCQSPVTIHTLLMTETAL